jgi:hypothetical protein
MVEKQKLTASTNFVKKVLKPPFTENGYKMLDKPPVTKKWRYKGNENP